MSYNNSINTFDKISDLKLQRAAPNIRVNVLGYNEPGDEGGGSFYWDDTSVDSEDGGTVFSVSGVSEGRWKRIIADNTISIKHFGCKGDGITDDTIKLQAAFNTAKIYGASVFIPKTENGYLVSTTINNTGCNIKSDGATVKATTPTFHLLFVEGASKIEICNINLEFQTPQQTAQSLGFCPIFINNSTNVYLSNIHVKNGGSFYINACTDVLVDNCSIIRAHYMGFFVHNSSRVHVRNCYGEKVFSSFRAEQCYDIEFVNNEAYDNWNDPVRVEDSQRVKIIGNTARNCYGGMGAYGPHSGFAYDTEDILFDGNVIVDCFYSATDLPSDTPTIMKPNIMKGALGIKSFCKNVVFTNNLVRSTVNAETIFVPRVDNTVFTFPGFNTTEVRTDTTGNSVSLLERYGNYIYAVDTDPVTESNRREGSWYYVNFDNSVDLTNTKFTIDFFVPTVTLVPGVFEMRLYSGTDRTGFLGSLPMYNAGVANAPLSSIFNTNGLGNLSVQCIELYCIKDQITDPSALTPSGVYMSNIRKGLDQRIGFWYSHLNNEPTDIYISNSNTFINVAFPILHKRTDAADNKLNYSDRVDDRGSTAYRPLNVPDGYRYFNTDTNKLEIKSNSSWATWPDGNWATWPDAPTLHDVLNQGNSSFLPIILNNQSYRADGTGSSNGYGLYNEGIIQWLLGKVNNDFGLYRYVNGTFTDRPFNISNATGNITIGATGSGVSTLDLRGSLTLSTSATSTAASLNSTNLTLRCDTSSGSYNVSLPAASACFGRIYIIKKVTSDANTVTIIPVESIDSQVNIVLRSLNDVIIIQSTGAFWNILSSTLSQTIMTKNSNYAATISDSTILVDSSSGNVTITLPVSGIPIGKTYVIKKMSAANTVTVDPQGTSTIDGGSSLSITTQYTAKQVQFDGTNYVVINS